MESLQLQHGHSNIFEQLRMEVVVPKLYRKSVLRGAKLFQDTLRSFKAIWHFVKFNPIPHILPALSKLRCPMNLATLPCLPLQNRISFQREMCPSKICIFLASNYRNIFHLLCLSLRTFSLPFKIHFVGLSVLHPDLLQADLLAKEFPKLSLWEAESPSRKWTHFVKWVLFIAEKKNASSVMWMKRWLPWLG